MLWYRQPLARGPLTRPRSPWWIVAWLALAALILAILLPGTAWAVQKLRERRGDTPAVEAAPPPENPDGGTATLVREVTVPLVPARLDLVLLLDVSASYADALTNLQAAAPDLARQVGVASDARLGLATFSDHPETGSPSDHPYRYVAPLASGVDGFTAAVGSVTILDGGDVEESSLEALDRLLQDPGLEFRDDARRVVVVATDAQPHLPGDAHYAGRGLDQIRADLAAQEVTLVLVSPSPGIRESGTWHDLVGATDGAILPVEADGADLADAVVAGLSRIPGPFEPSAVCPGFAVTFTPAVVTRDGDVEIAIRPTTAPRGRHRCRLDLGASRSEVVTVRA